MEILYSIVSGVATKVGEYAVVPVGRQVGYVIQYKSNLQNLRTQVDDLKERRQRTIDVNTITQQVDELTGEVDTFLVDEAHAKTKCFHGFCPNPILYYQLSKKATKLMHKIKLHEETEFPLQEICSVPSQDYLAFESRISVVKEIMDELSNPNTNKIGVYGVGGLGKTTLAKEVYRQANAKKLFDGVVIVVDVKNYPERIQKENYIERIQKEIAEKLNINIRECLTEKGRARLLCDKLRDKKILVILDDVWEKIELEDVGIPPTCNILFTSRNREVLYCQMGTQKDFSLDVLDEEESRRLFEKMAGAVVKDKRIREIATHVLNRCGGLPILIVAVASALRVLHVQLCTGVEVIVGKKEGPQTTIPKFMFPKVICVEFEDLPQLMSFYPGMHSSKWPLLKELKMNGCDKVGIFATEFLRFHEKLASAPGSKQPFFLIEKGSLLNLESLFLGDAELEIWDGPLTEEFSATWSCKLKKFWCYSKSSAAFLEKLRNLELLSMGYTPFKEIFVNEAYSSSVGSPQLLHLTFLQLYKMPELVHLGKDNSQLVIPNLKILQVWHCVRLRNLTSPAIAFQNLTSLKVIGCHGLEFLTTCSIAQSLMQLKHMEVKDCRGLIQILENSNQDLGSIEIAFLRLQHLELSGLPSLQCFCSGNCIVKLPSLDTLTVTDCLIELELSPEKLLHSNSRPEKIKLIEEEEKDHDKPEGSGKTRTHAT